MGCNTCGCQHESHPECTAPRDNNRLYTKANFCLKCIPCFNCEGYLTPMPIVSLSGDESFLCRICYSRLIIDIFHWNLKKSSGDRSLIALRDERIPEIIKQYHAGDVPENILFGLMNDIRGALLESPFMEDRQTTRADVSFLQRCDEIISWNKISGFARRSEHEFLSKIYGEELANWNNFLNGLPFFSFNYEPHSTVNMETEILQYLSSGTWTRGK